MACSSHPFPKLPSELRIRIWDAACLSYDFYSPRQTGMHCMNMEPNADGTTLLAFHEPTADAIGGYDNSACLVHALLTACKESRDAVSRYWNDCRYGDVSLPPARLPVREIGGVWHAPVYTTEDIFCIKSQSWKPLVGNDRWNVDLPESYYNLASENSARGFFSRFFYSAYLNYATEPTIYLIQKTGQWTSYWPSDEIHDNSFCHDYNTDHALVQPYYACFRCQDWHESDGVSENVRSFINKLQDLCEACEPDRPNNKPDHSVDLQWMKQGYATSDSVRYLARLDQKIEDCVGPQVNKRFPMLRPGGGDIWDSGFM
ncbi:hypothetical protein FAGAP_8844 [Fusarium agapanthi]|uniref:2EXR domain-containing protein n=1 Tax=Fusarium agapanthi TaxID=1803897 RepID=A0A9P5B4T8_9HYPO|nr:hypothetical protein FAGAP_8844 [Fusarium agapanthi]